MKTELELVPAWERATDPVSKQNTIAEDLFMRLHVAWLEYQVEVHKTLRLQDQLNAQLVIAQGKESAWNVQLTNARTVHGKTEGEGIDMVNRVWVAAAPQE